MIGPRIRDAVLLALLAALATVGVFVLSAGTPLRIAAGIALLLGLPWLAASRLAPLRDGDLAGGRVSGSGALSITLVVLLGLLLAVGGNGITTHGIAVGMLIVTAALTVMGEPGDRPLPRPNLNGRRVLSLVLTAAAVAIAVFAFIVARDGALKQAREDISYAAFLTEDGDAFDVGLSNSTGRAALFGVRAVGEEDGAEATITVPPKSTRTVREFVDRPPELKPLDRLAPRRVEPVKIRVTVTVDGKRRGPVLTLSTYAP
jgi:hypothetical protein